jgi:hypothetical protein
MGANTSKASATIAISATTSNAVSVGQSTVVGVEFPAAFTGATVSFTTCDTFDGTYLPLYDTANALVTVTKTGAAGIASINPRTVEGLLPYVKVVSASTEAAERAVKLIIKNLA